MFLTMFYFVVQFFCILCVCFYCTSLGAAVSALCALLSSHMYCLYLFNDKTNLMMMMMMQVRPMAHMQLQIEKEMRRKTSPLSETVRVLFIFKFT